ncbi:MAG: GTP cyclohydrolase I FolE [Planctomycetota bacterium]
MDTEKIRRGVRLMLEGIGENLERQGLLETPDRVARMYEEIFAGMNEEPGQHLEKFFDEEHHEMVLVRDIPFYSMCEHHLMPFTGRAHVGYIPNGKLVGLSKIARVVEAFARRPQVQERLTSQIADLMVEKLKPEGVGVVIDAVHTCMTMRGVRKPGSRMITSAVRGVFYTDLSTREEFMALVRSQLENH